MAEFSFAELPPVGCNSAKNFSFAKTCVINGEMIDYTYTASGVKIRQQVETDGRGGISTRRDYAGAFVFVNNAPGWVGTPHGRFVYFNGSWQNEFHLRDHASTSLSTGLGNWLRGPISI